MDDEYVPHADGGPVDRWNAAPGARLSSTTDGQDAAAVARSNERPGSAALQGSWMPDTVMGVDVCKPHGPSGEVARGVRAVELDDPINQLELPTAVTRGNQLQTAVTLAQAEQMLSKKAMKSRVRRDRQRQVWALRDLLMSKAAALSDDSSDNEHPRAKCGALVRDPIQLGVMCTLVITNIAAMIVVSRKRM